MGNCSQHKKEVAGITDMAQLAEMIGDLHYESLHHLLIALSNKVYADGKKDKEAGRLRLYDELYNLSLFIGRASDYAWLAWKISEPYMKSPNAL